MEQKGEKWE
jgi:hypothetical protein